MSRHNIITNLTADQEAMIPVYREKWYSIAISKEPINHDKIIACDRLCKLLFDVENRLHGEGEFALEFADGYGVYANHGQCLSTRSSGG